MVRGKPFKDPGDLFYCGSRISEDEVLQGHFRVILPENLVEKLGLKDGDWLIWKDYYTDSKGNIIIRAELSRRS